MVGVTTTAEWITAFGTGFAAVGTVGAVIVALWQTRRQERYGLAVEGKTLIKRDMHRPNKWDTRIEFVATNTGRRAITIAEARLEFKSADGIMVGVMRTDNEAERVTLGPGEQVVVAWDGDEIEATRKEMNGEPFMHCDFIDSLNNIYSAPYPGRRVSRKNWRLQRRYVMIRGLKPEAGPSQTI
jgi:hypothetical protein